jgi:hypothetical protein
MLNEFEHLSIDFLLLADRAEVVNGKLYAMGAAWERIGVSDFAQPLTISFALGVLVPWNATNRPHTVALTIHDADGRPLDFRVEASFVTGRPPNLNGETQRVLLAVPTAGVHLPGPGSYVLSAAVDGLEAKSVRFSAAQAAAQAPSAPPPPS